MTRLFFFIVAIIIVDASVAVDFIIREYDVIHVVDNHNTCSREDAKSWVNGFVNCFTNKKYKSSPDLFNIVTKLLDHSKACIKFATVECRPNYEGFMRIMGKIIEMIKEYSNMHLERLMNAGVISYSERDKIKDFECIGNSLTRDTYANCFSNVISTYEQLLGENETYDLIFQKEVETAIICTNIAHKQCSKAVKTDLNKVVRYILGVRQPERDDAGNDRSLLQPLSSTKPSNLPSELRNTAKEKMEDNFKMPKLFDSAIILNTTKFPVTETEEMINNLKVSNFSTLLEKSESDSDKNFSNPEKSLNSTENPIFIEQANVSNQAKPKNENLEISTKITDNIENTETALFLDFSKSIDSSKLTESSDLKLRIKNNDSQVTVPQRHSETTQFPKLEDISNSTSFDAPESTVVEETRIDTEIDRIEWEMKSTVSIESDKLTELSEYSEPPIPGKNDKTIQFTESLEITESPNPKDLSYSISIDNSNSSNVADTGKDILIDSETIDRDTKSTSPSKPPKLTDPSLFTTSTIPPKPTIISKSTTPGKSPKTTILSKFITSTVSPEPTVFSKSTKSPLRKSTTSARPSKPTELPKSTTSKRSTVISSTEYFRPRNTRYDPPRPRPYDPPPPRPTDPPRRPWYDYIIQPFVSLWRTVKSWFGW